MMIDNSLWDRDRGALIPVLAFSLRCFIIYGRFVLVWRWVVVRARRRYQLRVLCES